MTVLDQLMPASNFAERHHRDMAGSPEQTYSAVRAFTLAELPLARALFALRGMAAGRGRLVEDSGQPLLAQMTTRGFTVLADLPGRECRGLCRLPGTGVRQDGHELSDGGPRPRTGVITDTRVLATDAGSRWAFALYWLPVRIGSGLIRRAMLRAIARRTTQAAAATATFPTSSST